MNEFKGFDDFSKLMGKYIKKTEKGEVLTILEEAAEDFARDVRALPKPRRNGSGYTHLLDTVGTKREKDEVVVGWGKYYGPMVERGTAKMAAQSHMRTTFEQNKNKYYEKIQRKLFD